MDRMRFQPNPKDDDVKELGTHVNKKAAHKCYNKPPKQTQESVQFTLIRSNNYPRI